jgi:hypothetical protein
VAGRGGGQCGGPDGVRRPTPDVAALETCWHARQCTVVRSCMFRRAGIKQRERQRCGGGGPGGSPPFFHVSWPGSGQGSLGLDREGVPGYGYRARAHYLGVIHSSLDFPKFCPPGVRHNARMNSKFEFLKTATVGCQDI